MGIDLFEIDQQGDAVSEERFANVSAFYNLCQLIGYALPSFRELQDHPHEEPAKLTREIFEWFDEYIQNEREQSEEAFRNYCEFTTSIADQLDEQGAIPAMENAASMRANPADFDPDVRALFGRLIFSGDLIQPNPGSPLSLFCQGILGVWTMLVNHYQEENRDEIIGAIAAADECLRTLVEALERAATNNNKLLFEP